MQGARAGISDKGTTEPRYRYPIPYTTYRWRLETYLDIFILEDENVP
jgi:hypothetical protein